jgi:phosphodiesterase/alkaline phosphatase D-like protein
VNYGLEPNNLNLTAQSEVERVHFQGEGRVWVHRVRLEGLERGKKYYYRVNLPGVAEEKRSGEFMADPGDEGAIRVLFGADVFDASSAFQRLSQARGEIHLPLHAGDVSQGKL